MFAAFYEGYIHYPSSLNLRSRIKEAEFFKDFCDVTNIGCSTFAYAKEYCDYDVTCVGFQILKDSNNVRICKDLDFQTLINGPLFSLV